MRLDQALVDLGLVETRSKAHALVLAGRVRVGGRPAAKPGADIPDPAAAGITVLPGDGYVSRGGHKLAGALDALAVDPSGLTCLDAGASTGGFTDCLLRRGATRVYAVDVGYGQLAWSLRSDPRVVVMERTNVRFLGIPPHPGLPEPVDLATADLSFISLTKVLPALSACLRGGSGGRMVLMVKPQFELSQREVGKGGVVRDDALRAAAADRVAAAAAALGLTEAGRADSALLGPKGNQEVFLLLRPLAG